jgi:hypothetical protein
MCGADRFTSSDKGKRFSPSISTTHPVTSTAPNSSAGGKIAQNIVVVSKEQPKIGEDKDDPASFAPSDHMLRRPPQQSAFPSSLQEDLAGKRTSKNGQRPFNTEEDELSERKGTGSISDEETTIE